MPAFCPVCGQGLAEEDSCCARCGAVVGQIRQRPVAASSDVEQPRVGMQNDGETPARGRPRAGNGIASLALGLGSAAELVSFIFKVPFFGDYGFISCLLLGLAAFVLGRVGITGTGVGRICAILGSWISAAALTGLVVEFFRITLSAR